MTTSEQKPLGEGAVSKILQTSPLTIVVGSWQRTTKSMPMDDRSGAAAATSPGMHHFG